MDFIQISLLTVLVGLVVTLAVSYFQSSSFTGAKNGISTQYRKPTFLILGPNNAGKTSLYFRLEQAANDEEDEEKDGNNKLKITPTVSSIEPNYGSIKLPISNRSIAKPFQLIDFPGHLKYFQLLNKLIVDEVTLQKIKGIIYVIDSSSSPDDLREVAKHLFRLLSITEKLTNGIDFLFAINKNELFNSRPVFKIQEILELEITQLIQEQLSEKFSGGGESGIDQGDDEEDGETSGGFGAYAKDFWSSVVGSNGKFRFEMLEGNMDFFNGSVLKNKIGPWENWLDEKVVN
ncbi:signal recognition particle receptor subunit beta [[Candida] anglica]|uniref:Signal recognition particle receptor subunit beta n=1 Tax=[Candida] anglica TaxID=148631 RepID=A0ABP0EFH7_9ASCO